MFQLLHRLARWVATKTAPSTVAPSYSETPFIDAYRRVRTPSAHELVSELKNTAYTCATLNAGVCASYPPRLYVTTRPGERNARCLTRSLSALEQKRLGERMRLKGVEQIEEVVEHPLLTLLQSVNPTHNAHDLWELTTLYQEVHGSAYWQIVCDSLGVPQTIWILPSQHVRAVRSPQSSDLVDWYEVRTNNGTVYLSADEVIHFRYPDPRDPYGAGLSPLRAVFEHVALSSEYVAYKRTIWGNNALPGVVLSPEEIISEEERQRLETAWAQKFSRGGQGRVLVAESNLNVEVLQQSLGDLATLAEAGATKEQICNAFGIPVAFLTSETNLANLQASEQLHASRSIRPRLQRRDEKLNEQLIPLYDTSGRLFLASDDPAPRQQEFALKQQETDLQWGIRTVNEVRAERGLPPVDWGGKPWLPMNLAPTDSAQRVSGRDAA